MLLSIVQIGAAIVLFPAIEDIPTALLLTVFLGIVSVINNNRS